MLRSAFPLQRTRFPWTMLYVLCSFLCFIAINGFTGVNNRCMHRMTRLDVFPDSTDKRDSPDAKQALAQIMLQSFAQTPGSTRMTPISSTERSQKELTKIVLSTVILWMTWDSKLRQITQSAIAATQKNNLSDSATAGDVATAGISGSIVETPLGIQYEDVVVNAGEGQRTVVDGDSVSLRYTLFYNGLVVARATNDVTFVVGRDRDNGNGWDVSFLPQVGISEALTGMSVGGRRRATLPAALGFGSTGMPPFVPPGGTVLFELDVVSIT